MLDYFYIHWKTLLKTQQENINYDLKFNAAKSFLFLVLMLLSKYSKYKLKFNTKHLVTPGIRKPNAVKMK